MSLNPYQQNYLYASLSSFEKALRLADQLLVEDSQRGILYYQKSNLDPAMRQSARNKISQALQELSNLANQLGIEAVEENSDQMIMAQMSASWADLVDSQSGRLEGYGELDRQAAALIDPAVNRLARLASELGEFFTLDSTIG
jgi:tetratricopeptide (TPR) repeat protein